jgi:hypothetical protein
MWVQFGVTGLHILLLNICEFRSDWRWKAALSYEEMKLHIGLEYKAVWHFGNK